MYLPEYVEFFTISQHTATQSDIQDLKMSIFSGNSDACFVSPVIENTLLRGTDDCVDCVVQVNNVE